jgi:phospholipid transport system substrate-binding protein
MLLSFGRFAASAALTIVVLAGAARAQELVAPDVLVKDVTLEVVDVLQKDKEIRAGDRAKVIALIEAKVLPHFNFSAMAASAVGKNWEKANPEQKTRLTDEFRTLLVRTYSSAISAYRDQKFDFRPLRAKPTDTDVTVNVRIIEPGGGRQPITLDYDMEKRPSGWKVWDVRINGISLVINYRTEFDNQVRQSGIEGLIQALQTKNKSLELKPAVAAEKK